MKDKLFKNTKAIFEYIVALLRWLVLGLTVGAFGGTVGAGFAHSISFVTELREEHKWIILLLPLGGILSVAIYKACRVTDIGTNRVLESVRSETKVPYLLAPAIFIGACLTHLFGGSAGREGAALQLGGSVASVLGGVFRLDEKTRHILTMCGMGAFFSALFGTPIGACVFALEVVSVGHFCSAAFFPAIVSSVSAYGVAVYLGVKPERFIIGEVAKLGFDSMWRVAVVAVAGALVSILFCYAVHSVEHLFAKTLQNRYLRIAVGGVLIVALTAAVGTADYNGGGIEVIAHVFETGEVKASAFLLKILFTVITIGAGFKGGEIVPTLFIGATLGATVAGLIGLPVALGAAVGMASMLSGVTNCPLATVVLCVELFEGRGFLFCAVAAVTGFLLSGNSGLYTGQRLVYSKLNDEEINANAN